MKVKDLVSLKGCYSAHDVGELDVPDQLAPLRAFGDKWGFIHSSDWETISTSNLASGSKQYLFEALVAINNCMHKDKLTKDKEES